MYTFVKSINGSSVSPLPISLNVPQGLVVDSAGNILVADTGNNRVVILNSAGTSATIISSFNGTDGFSSPQDIGVTSSGFYVSDENNNRIVQFDSSGNFVKTFGSGNLRFPIGVAVDSTGNVYVADSGNNRVAKFDSTGTFVTSFLAPAGTNPFFPTGVAIDPVSGHIFVTDPSNYRVVMFDNTGSYVSSFGSQGVAVGQFANPQGVAVDSAGNVLVTDLTNGRVEKFYGNGTFITVFGSFTSSSNFSPGQFDSPTDVATDPSGNVYVTDTNFNNISVYNFAPGGSPPPAPIGLTGSVIPPNSVTLSWAASPGATSYTIYNAPSPGGPFTPVGGTTTATFTDILNTAATYYEVSATSPSGQSGFSNVVNIAVPPAPLPPTSVTAAATSPTSITVSWAASTGATSYTIYRSVNQVGPFNIVVGTSETQTFADATANPSTTYYYEVAASNAGGTSVLSSPPASATTPPLPPTPPTSVTAAATSPSTVTVSWTASPGAVSYVIYRSTNPLGPFTVPTGTSTTLTFNDTGLAPSTSYYYEVAASNAGGTSLPSTPPVLAMTLAGPPPPPLPPTSVTAAATSPSTVTVSWAASAGATSYTIYRSTNPLGPFTTHVGTSTTLIFNDTGLAPSTFYFYEITASNAGGTSALSVPPAYAKTLAALPATCPPAPTANNILGIGNYVVFGIHGVHLESYNTVSCGNVGEEPINNEIHIESNSRLSHSGILGSNVHVEGNTTLYQIFYSHVLQNQGSSTIAPAKINTIFVSLPSFLPAADVLGTNDVDVASSGSTILPAGPAYGKISVGNGARLEFAGGNYTIDSLMLGNYSKIVFDSPTTISVRNGIEGGQSITINPTSSQVDPRTVLFYVGKQVHLGDSSTVNANMYAMQEIHFGQKTTATGAFIAFSIHIESNSVIKFDYGFPTVNHNSN